MLRSLVGSEMCIRDRYFVDRSDCRSRYCFLERCSRSRVYSVRESTTPSACRRGTSAICISGHSSSLVPAMTLCDLCAHVLVTPVPIRHSATFQVVFLTLRISLCLPILMIENPVDPQDLYQKATAPPKNVPREGRPATRRPPRRRIFGK